MELYKQKSPELIKMSSTYKLIVPSYVEEKIRYLLRKYPHTEWSGILFTSHQGTFEGNDLVITCQDIYPMDLGDTTFTQFKMSEDVAGYIADNINLFGCDMGLIHSHHTMNTFFSSTDTATLQSEGADTNCFVSLIVNNAGTYNAAVTRKIKEKKEVTIYHYGKSYEFFGDGEVITEPPYEAPEVNQKMVDEEKIEYFILDVEREEVANPLAYLDTRFDEIERKKQAEKPKQRIFFDFDAKKETSYVYPLVEKKEKPKEGFLWNTNLNDEFQEENDYCPDQKLIDDAVAIMLTCSFLVDASKFDRETWIEKHMEKALDKVFDLKSNPVSFNDWAEFIVEYTITNFFDPAAPDYYLYGEGMDLYQSIVAEAILSTLFPYDKKNGYISAYCTILSKY